MVRRFGFYEVIDAVRDLNGERVQISRAFNGTDGKRYPSRWSWRFDGLRNPGGFLRRTLEDREHSK